MGRLFLFLIPSIRILTLSKDLRLTLAGFIKKASAGRQIQGAFRVVLEFFSDPLSVIMILQFFFYSFNHRMKGPRSLSYFSYFFLLLSFVTIEDFSLECDIEKSQNK
jgi:hypothetical protein